jgi:hypothetical protein
MPEVPIIPRTFFGLNFCMQFDDEFKLVKLKTTENYLKSIKKAGTPRLVLSRTF